jgi:transposase
VGAVRERLGEMFDAGAKDKLLDTVSALLTDALRNNQALAGRVADLQRRLYGKKSERIDPNQLALSLGELREQQAAEPEPETEPEPAPLPPPKPRKRRGRRSLPADLPREEVRLTPTEEQIAATSGNLRKMGEERSEVLEYEPARFKVIVYIREVWSSDVGEVVTAPVPNKVIEKGLPGPGLLAQVVLSKYRDHLPLNRQVSIYRRAGVTLSRNTLVDWIGAAAWLLEALARLICKRAMASHVLQVDDTKLPVQDRRKPKQLKRGHMWALVGDHRYVAYRYTDNWRADTAVSLLGARIGWMQVDGYAGYRRVFERGLAMPVGCWMHARRYFVRAYESRDLRAAEPLEHIRAMYRVEREAKDAGDTAEERRLRRRRDSEQHLAALRRWIDEHRGQDPPSSPLAKAIGYAENHWDALCAPLFDGALELDNGDVERALRGTALGRKNWLFAGSDEGAARAAVLCTVLETAARHQLDIGAYLRDVLIKISGDWPMNRLEELLPENWQRTHAERQADASAGAP